MTTMPTWLLCVTYAASGGVGYAACYFGVVKMGTALARGQVQRKVTTMLQYRTPWLPIVILVAAAMVVAIGAMSYLDDRARDKADATQATEQGAYDRCITAWGDDLVASIAARGAARVEYDDAAVARGDATADVLRVALELSQNQPGVQVADLRAALLDARRADRLLARAARELETSQEENVYKTPTLACAAERTPR